MIEFCVPDPSTVTATRKVVDFLQIERLLLTTNELLPAEHFKGNGINYYSPDGHDGQLRPKID
jgi:hypothetical protein